MLVGEVLDFNGIGKLRLAQIRDDLILSGEHFVYDDFDVSLLLESSLIPIIYNLQVVTVVNNVVHLKWIVRETYINLR